MSFGDDTLDPTPIPETERARAEAERARAERAEASAATLHAELLAMKAQLDKALEDRQLFQVRAEVADRALMTVCADAEGLAGELFQATTELKDALDRLEASQAAHRRDRKLLAAAYGRSTEGRFG